MNADLAEALDQIEIELAPLLLDDDLHIDVTAVPKDLQAQRFPGPSFDDAANLFEGADVLTLDAHDAVPRPQDAVRWVLGQDDPHGRRREGSFRHEDREIEEHGEDQIHDRAGQHDHDALVERQALERALLVLRQDEVALGLLEHLDVPAERQERHAILRLAPGKAEHLWSEAQGEGEHLHPKGLGE